MLERTEKSPTLIGNQTSVVVYTVITMEARKYTQANGDILGMQAVNKMLSC